MWKMQLLDEDHLLIKYASEDVVTLRLAVNHVQCEFLSEYVVRACLILLFSSFRSVEPNSQQSFFVVYNMKTTEVLAVHENTSEKLLNIFENFCDSFRNSNLNEDCRHTSSPSNNVFANLIQQRFKQTIISAKVKSKLFFFNFIEILQ